MKKDYSKNCEIYFEHSLDISGFSYLVIFGHHINGGFIALPGWNITCEASAFADNNGYNAQRLATAGLPENVAEFIAEDIDTWIKSRKRELVS